MNIYAWFSVFSTSVNRSISNSCLGAKNLGGKDTKSREGEGGPETPCMENDTRMRCDLRMGHGTRGLKDREMQRYRDLKSWEMENRSCCEPWKVERMDPRRSSLSIIHIRAKYVCILSPFFFFCFSFSPEDSCIPPTGTEIAGATPHKRNEIGNRRLGFAGVWGLMY